MEGYSEGGFLVNVSTCLCKTQRIVGDGASPNLWCDSNRSHVARLPVCLDRYLACARSEGVGESKQDLS